MDGYCDCFESVIEPKRKEKIICRKAKRNRQEKCIDIQSARKMESILSADKSPHTLHLTKDVQGVYKLYEQFPQLVLPIIIKTHQYNSLCVKEILLKF